MRMSLRIAVASLVLLLGAYSDAQADAMAPVSAWEKGQHFVIHVQAKPFEKEALSPTKKYSLDVQLDQRDGDWSVYFRTDQDTPGLVGRELGVILNLGCEPKEVRGLLDNATTDAPLPGMISKFGDGSFVTGAPEGFPVEIFAIYSRDQPLPLESEWTRQTEGSPFKLVIKRNLKFGSDQFVVDATVLRGETEELRIRQVWVRGEPWWREYERFVRGQRTLHATLDSESISEPARLADEMKQDDEREEHAFLERYRHLRADPRLRVKLDLVKQDPPLEYLLEALQKATGIPLTADAGLLELGIILPHGSYQIRGMEAWKLMGIASDECRIHWVKDGETYRLQSTAHDLAERRKQRPPSKPEPDSRWLAWIAFLFLFLVPCAWLLAPRLRQKKHLLATATSGKSPAGASPKRSRTLRKVAIVGYLAFLFLIGFLIYKHQSRHLKVENFSKIEKGMSRKEVESLLGGPSGYYSWNTYHYTVRVFNGFWNIYPNETKTWWLGDRCMIWVAFVDEKVAWTQYDYVDVQLTISESVLRYAQWLYSSTNEPAYPFGPPAPKP